MKIIKMKDMIEYLLVFALILECNTAYTRFVNIDLQINWISGFIVIAFAFFVLLNLKDISKHYISFMSLLIIWLIIYLINSVKGVHTFDYIVNYLIFLISLLIFYYEDKNNMIGLLKKLSNVVIVLCIVSLFFYILGTNLKWLPSSRVLIKWGGLHNRVTYGYMHFDTQTQYILGKTFERNTGIFTEAPMFAFVIISALFSEIIIESRKKIFRLSVLIITMLSTICIAGIGLSILLVLFIYITKHKKNKLYSTIKILIVPVMIISIILVFNYMLNNKKENQSGSYSVRLDDYNASYLAWREKPIFGNGFYNTSMTELYMSKYRLDNLGQSNAIGKVLSEGGLWMSVLYLFSPVCLMLKGIKLKNQAYFLTSFMFLVAYTTINTPYRKLTILLLSVLIFENFTETRNKEYK